MHCGRFVKAASKVALLRTKFQSLQISSLKAYGQLGFHDYGGVAFAGVSREALLPQEQLQRQMLQGPNYQPNYLCNISSTETTQLGGSEMHLCVSGSSAPRMVWVSPSLLPPLILLSFPGHPLQAVWDSSLYSLWINNIYLPITSNTLQILYFRY